MLTDGRTDIWTDGHKDGWMDRPFYRDARTHLKTKRNEERKLEAFVFLLSEVLVLTCDHSLMVKQYHLCVSLSVYLVCATENE